MKRCTSAPALFTCICLVLGAACDSSNSDPDAALDDSAAIKDDALKADSAAPDPIDRGAEPDTVRTDLASPACDLFPDRSELAVTKSRFKAKADEERGNAMRIMYAANSTDPLFIRVMLWQGLTGSPAGPTTIALQDVPRDLTGGVLVRFGHGCDPQGRDCTTDFVGFSGTLKLDSLEWSDPDGKLLSGELQQVLFKQVTYDANETAIEVPGGCAFTLDAHAFSGTVSTSSGNGDD